MSTIKKCYACSAQATTKFIRRFPLSGIIKDVYSCPECTYLSDAQFELKRKATREKNKNG